MCHIFEINIHFTLCKIVILHVRSLAALPTRTYVFGCMFLVTKLYQTDIEFFVCHHG